MSYVIFAIIAWSIYGVLSIVDKFLLDKPINDASVYTYYTGLVSIFMVILFAPFMRVHSLSHVLLDLAAGFIFLASQYCLFVSIIEGSVSEVVPITGALVPIFSLVFVNYGLHIALTAQEVAAFAFLVAGTILISIKQNSEKKEAKHGELKPSKKHIPVVVWAVASSLFAAAYFTLVKVAYSPFKENFALVRLGSTIGAVMMLLSPHVRSAVFKVTKNIRKSKSGHGTSVLFVGKSIVAGIGFIILNYAISIGNPALVNALQGVEYVVIFGIAIFLTYKYPEILKEESSGQILTRKVGAIVLIVIGFFLLQLS